MQKKRDLLLNRKIWSRRSSISPKFVDCSVRIYNGKTPVRRKITEGKIESDKPPDEFPFRDSDYERESLHSPESEGEPRGQELRLAPPGEVRGNLSPDLLWKTSGEEPTGCWTNLWCVPAKRRVVDKESERAGGSHNRDPWASPCVVQEPSDCGGLAYVVAYGL
ncbi:hypothetical protein NE237_032935 [Protea cynaroides]|uniref:Uncharacterized protein n=1 Tax=Protea cynaroides TaxID=273540 RepID=A0A9Q0L3Y1_9MAGN|nr:hypothetical protein NE237_032935 [Protea cynaroides]